MEISEVLIRKPSMEDVHQIVHINRVCLPENYSLQYFISIIQKYKEFSVVAEVDNKVVGYVLTRIERMTKGFVPFSAKRGHIISVAVLPEYRGRGIGAQMMQKVVEKLKEEGMEEVILEVRVSNAVARSLYFKLGFHDEEILKRYYLDGEDAALMKLSLV